MKKGKRRTQHWKKVVSGILCTAMLCTTLGISAPEYTTAKEKATADCAAEAQKYSEKKEAFKAAEEAKTGEEQKPEAEKKTEEEKQTEKKSETEKKPETEKQTEKAPETEKQTEKAPETERQTEKKPETEKQTEKAPETEKQTGEETEKKPETEKQTETAAEQTEETEKETQQTEVKETENTLEKEETSETETKKKDALRRTAPLRVEDYVVAEMDGHKTQLRYRTAADEPWQEGGKIPGNANLRLDVVFQNIPLEDILAADGKMVYTLPDIMREPQVRDNITAGNRPVGTIEVSGKTVTLHFNKSYLEEQQAVHAQNLNGQFYVESSIDLKYVESQKPGELVIGGVKIDLDFEGDIFATYGQAEIEKEIVNTRIEETEDGEYLTYRLRVTAGAAGCPEVRVLDAFLEHKEYVEAYVGVSGERTAISSVAEITENGAPAGKGGFVYLAETEKDGDGFLTKAEPAGVHAEKPGSMLWEIGDMESGEVRTLTYKIKLKPEYTRGRLTEAGGRRAATEAERRLRNGAEVYSGKYPKGDAEKEYMPRAQMDERKVWAKEPVKNADGSYTLTCQVWLKANRGGDNTMTLRNVKICDSLNHPENATAAKYLPYIKFDKGSFELHEVTYEGSKQKLGALVPTPPSFLEEGGDNPKINHDEHGFTYCVGDMAPGKEYILVYKIIVQQQVDVLSEGAGVLIKNRALLYTDSGKLDGKEQIQAWSANTTLNYKKWARKLVNETPLKEEKTIPLEGAVYELTGGGVQPVTDPQPSFTVPAGSYRYNVVANEDGDWDLSAASLQDTLGNDHMCFAGYIRVDAYEVNAEDRKGFHEVSDAALVGALEAKESKKTVWLKADSLRSFAFQPNQIGMEGNYAYLLSYYAYPIHMEEIAQIEVSNQFNISGDIGLGGVIYHLAGVRVEASVMVKSDNYFAMEKQGWYYDREEKDGNYTNGSLYWVIRVDGNYIPANKELKDIPVSGEQGITSHEIYADSVKGIFSGKKGLTGYKNYAEALASGDLREVPKSKYEVRIVTENGKRELRLKMKEAVITDLDTTIYIILRSNPSVLPQDKRDLCDYKNKIAYQDGADKWIEANAATQRIYGSRHVMKELNYLFKYDGTDAHTIKELWRDGYPVSHNVNMEKVNHKPGTYMAWTIKVNYRGDLEGRYTITDIIPEGMELGYVRMKWAGGGYPAGSRPIVPRKEMGEGWVEDSIGANTDNNRWVTTYYYTNGREVCWDVDPLVAGNAQDRFSVDFQILCRVTDENVILGGETKTFNNQVILTDEEGAEVGRDSDAVEITKETLGKQGVYTETNGGMYPFEVTLNELGEDLVEGSDKVTLVDTMSKSLTLEVSTIRVENTKTHAVIEDCKISVNGQTLKIELPDGVPLKVSYAAKINAQPGEEINISNSAHWEGYAVPEHGAVNVENFSYGTGAAVGTSGDPSVKIIKMNQNDVSEKLAGAKFELTECEYQDGAFVPKQTADGQEVKTEGTTGEDGTLHFTSMNGEALKWETVYRLTETQTPEGYVFEENAHYFALAKADVATGEYAPEVALYEDAGATICYEDALYEYQAYNHKGEAEIAKKFEDKEKEGDDRTKCLKGTYTFGIFEVRDGEEAEEAFQTVTIKFTGKEEAQEKTAKFAELDAGKTYVIYELDDDGAKIKQGERAMTSGLLFDVSYEGENTVNIPETEGEIPRVTVTNAVAYVELPELGGPGTRGIYGMALMLLMFAGSGLYLMGCRKKFS